MFGLHRLGASVHQQETAGAVGILRLAWLDAHLAEQSGLLVPGDTGDGDAGALARAKVGTTINLGGRAHIRQHLAWDIQGFQHRSEEHTSELQSLMRISYDVFCLKKKKSLQTCLEIRYFVL